MAKVNDQAVQRIALRIKELPLSGTAQTFTEEDKFPSVGDPGVPDYLFAVTIHEFGSWISNERGYAGPLYGEVDGKRLKGSDLLWTLSMKMYQEMGGHFFNPLNLAKLSHDKFLKWLPEKYQFYDMMTRYRMTVEYGQYARNYCNFSRYPYNLIRIANLSSNPLETFLKLTSLIPGYDKDTLLKKNLLLAMTLANRPEKFLKADFGGFANPIVDNHFMRLALRLGLIDLNEREYKMLARRIWVDENLEKEVRRKTYKAVREVIYLSGKAMSEIDFLMWNARQYCPEMTKPDCPKCVFDSVCQKRVALFQPVFRTTNY